MTRIPPSANEHSKPEWGGPSDLRQHLRPLQHRGENMKFFELARLNGGKQRA
jgi:hypothetical protein